MSEIFPSFLDDSQDSVYDHNFLNETVLADFIRDSYQTFSFALERVSVVPFLNDSNDNFFNHDFLNEVISANFLLDRYVAFENQLTISDQEISSNILDDSVDNFFNPFASLKLIIAPIIDDSIDVFYTPIIYVIQTEEASFLDDSNDNIFSHKIITAYVESPFIDDSQNEIFDTISKSSYQKFLRRYTELPDVIYPVSVSFDQIFFHNRINDIPDDFYSVKSTLSTISQIVDDSQDTFFTYKINYVFIENVDIISDKIDKIFPVGFFGVTLAPTEKNAEFFNEIKFDPYPAPITKSKVINVTITPKEKKDLGVTILNYPNNNSANVSAFLIGQYKEVYPNSGVFQYVERGSSDLLQKPNTETIFNNLPSNKTIFSFEENVSEQEKFVDYTLTVDYRIPDLIDINEDSNLNMIAWFDASDNETIITNNTNVIEWKDKSSSQNDLVSLFSDDSIFQIYYEESINTPKSIIFDYDISSNTNHVLVTENDLPNEITIFVLMSSNDIHSSVLSTYDDISNTEFYGYIGNQSTTLSSDINLNNLISNYYLNDYVVSVGSSNDYYTDILNLSQDLLIYSFTRQSGQNIIATGLLNNNFDSYKKIHEIIVYDGTLTKNDIQKIHASLAIKWNIDNVNILNQMNRKYGNTTYTIHDQCGGTTVYDSSIFTYSMNLNHLVTFYDAPSGTQYLLDYFDRDRKNIVC